MSNEHDQVTIDSIGRVCDIQFSSIIVKLSTAANSDKAFSKSSSLADERSRFELWAGNIGALQSGNRKTSLQYRLRKVPRVVKYIADLLKDLGGLLKDSVDFMIEEWLSKKTTIVEPNQTQGNTNDLQYGDLTMDGEDTSEIGMIVAAIGATITNLFRLSGLIREAVPRDRFEKAVERSAIREDAFQSTPDVNHVQDKFPRLRDESMEWFRDRLAQGITHRREYLRYCSEHQEHFRSLDSHNATDGTKSDGGTSASSVLPNELWQQELDVPRSSLSDTSSIDSRSTASVGDDHADRLQLPALSEVNGGANEFECPFCHIVLHNIKNQSLWRKHAFKDLRPYLCTFRGCAHKKLFSSRTEWFNHELEYHRSQWRCPFCSHGSIATLELFCEHVRIQHMQQLPETELETLTSLSRQSPRQFKCSSCPFCLNWETKLRNSGTQTVSPSRLRRHIGGHLEQLAFSVIRGLELNQDPQSSDSSETGEETQSVGIELNDRPQAAVADNPFEPPGFLEKLEREASRGEKDKPQAVESSLESEDGSSDNVDILSTPLASYAHTKKPIENIAKFLKGSKVFLSLGRPRGSFEVEIVEVRKHNGLYQYRVEQSGVMYNGGEWVEQTKLRERM